MESIAGIVLCAGQGTRMKSVRSKMLHHVAGVPVCCWPVQRVAKVAGHVIAVVGFQGDAVKQAISQRLGQSINFVLQPEQKGTGDAVCIALEEIPAAASVVLIVCGDTPLLREETLRALIETHKNGAAKVTFLVATNESPAGYGRVIRDSQGAVMGIVEESDTSSEQKNITEINAGIYAFDASFLKEHIHDVKNKNAKKELYLTDLVARARELFGLEAVKTCQIAKEEMVGINDRIQLSEAESIMRKRLNHYWMTQGVTMIDPATTYIEADVELNADVTLYPNVVLRGRTHIASGTTIFAHSVIEDATVGPNAQVGPFARLRPGTVLDENTHVGNFVEIKKSHLGRGTKANHLAYIGDAEIGQNCNIGAGTITCNYDGFHKHPTNIGDGTFIGSNSTLVAPITIGAQVYVGAGSTLNKDVPDDALAISRARQENKLGYAPRIKERLRCR